jgi:hypothetical protein
MKQALILGFICLVTAGCSSGSVAAPSDDEMIASFQQNRAEFEFWKGVFIKPDMHCFIQIKGGRLSFEHSPCFVTNEARLLGFMQQVGVIAIDAFNDARDQLETGPIQFRFHQGGNFAAGDQKSILFWTEYDGPLEDNLDIYNWGKISDPKLRRQGIWHRKIEDNWYLHYDADF